MDNPESLTFRAALVKAGLGGLATRVVVCAVAPWVLWWIIKPAVSFCADGSARLFGTPDPGWWDNNTLKQKGLSETCGPTWLPHWAIALLGLLVALLA